MRSIALFSSVILIACGQCLPATSVEAPFAAEASFQAFTGKVTREKVRLRLQPSLDCPVIAELKKGDLLVIVGEAEDFYAVQPPSFIKGYVYRTFVLDNTVEGSHVNVRLEPQLEAPILAQLNRGDRIDGKIAPTNSKWLEIELPTTTHLFVSRDYIDNIGHADLITTLTRRKSEVESLLAAVITHGESELQKPFEEIDLAPTWETYRQVMADYGDFTVEATQAADAVKSLQERYLKSKVAYLEERNASHEIQRPVTLPSTLASKQQAPQQLEQKQEALPAAAGGNYKPSRPTSLPVHMAAWHVPEQALYQQWRSTHHDGSEEVYVAAQQEIATTLHGTIEAYHSSAKNKPGDFILRNRHQQRVAYLYSYDVDLNLQDYVGRCVSMQVVSRSNHRFALPAYRVLSVKVEQQLKSAG